MQLILSWMGEGLRDREDGTLEFFSAYEKGLDIIRKLSDACLLEYHKQWCDFYLRLPKDVWDMAQKITNSYGFPYVVYCRNSGELGGRFWATATRISISELDLTRGTNIIFNPLPSSDATSLPQNNIPCCLNLTTFWAAGNKSLKGIHQDFCHFIPVVKVLDLSITSIKEIPRTMKLLTQLQYLMLEKTNITTLPVELGDLKKLRLPDLSDTKKLKIIPSVSISGLSALQALRMNESAYSWDLSLSIHNQGPLLEDRTALLKLDDLENLGQMQTLWLKIRSIQTLEKLLKSFTGATAGLAVSGEHFDKQYVEKLIGRFSQLRWLELHNCNKLEHLEIIRIELRFFQELKLTALDNVYRISSTDGSPLFPYLRHLAIWNCSSLVDLTWAAHLPVLELLCLSCCEQINQLIVNNEEDSVCTIGEPFPKLQFMVLHQLPELRCFSWRHPLFLPALRSSRIIQCPKFKKLPLGRQSGKNITEIRGSQEWWDELQWDNDGIKSAFLPYFLASAVGYFI